MGAGVLAVVANPGHFPWMAHSAVALTGPGQLGGYFTPLATSPNEAALLTRRVPAPLDARVRRELRRRRLPDSIPPSSVTRVAQGPELACVLGARLAAPLPLRRALADHRDRAFDRAVSRRIDSEVGAAHLAYGSALHSLHRARSLEIATLLEHPSHHHRFAEALLQEEVTINPTYAPTMQFHRPSERRRRRLDAEIEAADRVVVLSTFSKETFVAAGVEEAKIVVSPLGVDLEAFSPRRRDEDGIFRVLFVGVLTQRKGLSYLVDGFRSARIRDSELLLVGEPWRGSAPWRGEAGVRQVPWLRAWEVAEIYRSADVLVLPSLEEGFSRVVLEAMASGIPVIVTPNTGANDLVRDGVDGYVVPIRDPDAIAERLVHLQRNPRVRDEMGRAARDRAEEFPWERYGARILAAIGDAVGDGAGRRAGRDRSAQYRSRSRARARFPAMTRRPPAELAASLSVIIPTHDRAELLGDAIRSVLAQTLPPAEVIVIDDCSKDRTQDVLDSFGDAIRAVRTEENIERGAARNLGVRVASGKLLSFLDSDDTWEPEKLLWQLSAAGAGPSVTGVRFADQSGRVLGRPYLPSPASDQEILVNNYCLGGPSSLVLPREAFDEVGGFHEDREYQGSEDWLLLVKLHWAGWPIELARSPLVRYRVHPGGSTQRPENLERSMWAACGWIDRQRVGPPGAAPTRRSRAASAIACAYLAKGKWREARPWAAAALREGRPASRLHGASRIARTSIRRLATPIAPAR